MADGVRVAGGNVTRFTMEDARVVVRVVIGADDGRDVVRVVTGADDGRDVV